MSYVGFKKLTGQLQGRQGVTDPQGLAAYIMRRKYKESAVKNAEQTGHSLRGAPLRHAKKRKTG